MVANKPKQQQKDKYNFHIKGPTKTTSFYIISALIWFLKFSYVMDAFKHIRTNM